MSNAKTTKRGLFASVFAMLLCVAMFVGATFAWFTDSVTSGNNNIQAGNLDIELEYSKDGSSWASVKNKTDLFSTNLWEPGHTEVVYFHLSNEGTLALKYQLSMNIISETTATNVEGNTFKLSQYLKYAIVEGSAVYDTREAARNAAEPNALSLANYSEEHTMLAGAEDRYFAWIVYMPETVGNEANYRGTAPSIALGVNVVATQVKSESDSFGNEYDAGATYPVVANTQTELNNAISSAQNGSAIPTKVALPAGEFKLEDSTALNKNITISGTKDTVVTVVGDTGNQLNYQNGAKLTFEGVTIQGQTTGNFGGIAHVAETTFVNCEFEGKLTLYGDATFINCTFNNDSDYAIWTWGASNAEFIGCTFNSGGKAILLYGGSGSTATPTTKLTVTNCTFNDNDTLDTDKAAIEIGNDYDATYTLTVNNATVNGFADGKNTGSKLWANKNSMDAEHLTVTIDGSRIQ